MKSYIKPTFILAEVTPLGLTATGGCITTDEDLELIKEIAGIDPADKNVFAITEACSTQVPVMEYCKHTSVENGSAKVLTS